MTDRRWSELGTPVDPDDGDVVAMQRGNQNPAWSFATLRNYLNGFYAALTRAINTGDGLQGGGNLTADRTLSVDSTVTRTSRAVNTGDGLTGGGDLSQDRTLAVDGTVVRNNAQQTISASAVTLRLDAPSGNDSSLLVEPQNGTAYITLRSTNAANGDISLNFFPAEGPVGQRSFGFQAGDGLLSVLRKQDNGTNIATAHLIDHATSSAFYFGPGLTLQGSNLADITTSPVDLFLDARGGAATLDLKAADAAANRNRFKFYSSGGKLNIDATNDAGASPASVVAFDHSTLKATFSGEVQALGGATNSAGNEYYSPENPPPGGGGKHTIQDEGTPLTDRANLNFVGAGVTVTDGGAGPDSTIVTISGGAGAGYETIQEDGTPVTQRTIMNFGTGLLAADNAGQSRTDINIVNSEINHDALQNFVGDEHVAHSAVSVNAGNGLTGGGNIAATRTLTVGAGNGITVNANDVAVNEAQVNHDALQNFVGDEHVPHSGVSITAGAGLTGGGNIAATRNLDVGAGDGISVGADSVSVDGTVTRTNAAATVAVDGLARRWTAASASQFVYHEFLPTNGTPDQRAFNMFVTGTASGLMGFQAINDDGTGASTVLQVSHSGAVSIPNGGGNVALLDTSGNYTAGDTSTYSLESGAWTPDLQASSAFRLNAATTVNVATAGSEGGLAHVLVDAGVAVSIGAGVLVSGTDPGTANIRDASVSRINGNTLWRWAGEYS